MQLPAIHMNGSSKKTLIDDAMECRANVLLALGVLTQCGPNMRDFYVLPGGGEKEYKVALKEHVSRVERLRAVAAEFELIVEGLDKGGAFAVRIVDGAVVEV